MLQVEPLVVVAVEVDAVAVESPAAASAQRRWQLPPLRLPHGVAQSSRPMLIWSQLLDHAAWAGCDQLDF